MALPFIIANLPAGNNPASVLDANYAALAVGINVACTAGGTNNAIQLTPIANMPTIPAYANNNLFSFQAGATSTGSVTVAVAGLGALPLYKAPGVQAGSGDIVLNYAYTVMFVATLVGGVSPGFILVNAPASGGGGVATALLQGQFKNLKIAVLTNSTISLSFDQVVLANNAGGTVLQGPGSFTISTGSNNVVNGYDQVTGNLAQATWYAIHAIFNPSTLTLGGYMSSSASSPNLPSGFSYFVRLGYVTTAPSNTSLMGTLQSGRQAQYVMGVAQTLPANGLPKLATGTAGSVTVPTWAAIATGAFVPPTASRIKIIGNMAATNSAFMAAPNNSYGAVQSATNPPPWAFFQLGAVFTEQIPFEFLLESTNIYWANNAAANTLYCLGWEDNL
jgi:hypothetical protein